MLLREFTAAAQVSLRYNVLRSVTNASMDSDQNDPHTDTSAGASDNSADCSSHPCTTNTNAKPSPNGQSYTAAFHSTNAGIAEPGALPRYVETEHGHGLARPSNFGLYVQ